MLNEMIKTISNKLFTAQKENLKINIDYYITNPKEEGINESWYRDLIYEYPELVINLCILSNLTNEKWVSWGKEIPIYDEENIFIGKIDVLLISETGRIGIVETKLAYNPEIRRKVVSQVIDYAINLKYSKDKILSNYENPFDNLDLEEISNRIDDSDYLLIIAGDQMDPKALKLGKMILSDNLLNQWDLISIDLNLYKSVSSNNYFIIPVIRGVLEKEIRNIIKVDVNIKTDNPAIISIKNENLENELNNKNDYIPNLRAKCFYLGNSEPVQVKNWAELMVHLVKYAIDHGLKSEDLPMAYSTEEKSKYRKINDNLYISYAMTFNAACTYCNEILKKLKVKKDFLRIIVLDGSEYTFPY
jgi:hypothetical protein